MREVYVIIEKKSREIVAIYDSKELCVENYVSYSRKKSDITILTFTLNNDLSK